MAWFAQFSKNNQPANPAAGSFNGGGSAQASTQNNTGPANSQVSTIANPPQGNGSNPNQGQNGNSGPANPLDQFTSLFAPQQQQNDGGNGQNNPNGQNNSPQNPNPGPAYDGFIGAWNQEAVSQRASQLDFTRGIDPAVMENAMKGDSNAFMQVLNHVSRQSFMAAAQAGHGFADRATKTGLERFGSGLDDRIRDYGVRNQTVAQDHPVLSHPAMQPMVNALKLTIAQNDPKLSPQQIAEKVTQFFDNIGGAYQSNVQQETNQATKANEHDWLASFGLEAPAQRSR